MENLFFYICLILSAVLIWFYVQYRIDTKNLSHLVKRGDIKFLRRYAHIFKLHYLRDSFSNIPPKSQQKPLKQENIIKQPDFQSVFNSLNFPFMALDQQQQMVFLNKKAQKLFGEELVGKDIALTIRNPEFLNAVQQVLKNGTEQKINFHPKPTSALNFDVHLTAFTVDQPKHKQTYVLMSFHDMTMQANLQKMRTAFIANASHELKTPLTNLIGFIETLSNDQETDPASQKKFLKIMDGQAHRMSNLINDLLTLSQIELEEYNTPDEVCSLAPILQDVIDSLTINAKKRKMNLVFNKPNKQFKVNGNEDQLVQVFQNLIHNSIKYAHNETDIKITLSTDKAEKNAKIMIEDVSDGIEEKHLIHLTERFYRVDKARSKEMGGTGLGLAIVKHIINRHKGKLLITSQIGKGSCFTVLLPIV